MNFPRYSQETPSLNRYLLIFGSLFTVSQTLIISLLGDAGLQLLALQTKFTKGGFTSLVSAWGPAEFGKLRMHYWIDMLHPVWYALFLATLLAKLFNANEIAIRSNVFIWAPIIAGLCDWVENAIHAPFVYGLYHMPQPWIFLGAFFATVKWFLAAGSTVASLGLGGCYCLQRISEVRRK